jgi:hypothetical protein
MQVSRIRQMDISRMRLEEQERYRSQLNIARGEIESEFNQRAQRLRERENEIEMYLKRFVFDYYMHVLNLIFNFYLFFFLSTQT